MLDIVHLCLGRKNKNIGEIYNRTISSTHSLLLLDKIGQT